MLYIDKQTLHKREAVLFINGQPPREIPEIHTYRRIYCTDGAYSYLKSSGIRPHVVSGDFDSVKLEDIEEGVTVIYTPDQNYTDFEKAIRLIKNEGIKDISVYGCSGLEQDHFLGNIHTMAKYSKELNIRCFDDYGFYFFAEERTQIAGFEGYVLSLVPFPEVTGVESQGVLYPLYKESLKLTDRIGTRNTITSGVAEIDFEEGNLLVFVQNKR